MSLETLNKICFGVCLACILSGVVLAIAMIWCSACDQGLLWKAWQTICTFFVAATLTLSISKAMQSKVR